MADTKRSGWINPRLLVAPKRSDGGSTSFGVAQFAQVVSVAERVLLRDKGMPGGQDFFNDTSVGIGAKLIIA